MNKMLTSWTGLRRFPAKVSSFGRRRQQMAIQGKRAGRVEIRNTPRADLTVDEVHTSYVDWPLCATIFPLCNTSIEGGALCKLRTR